MGNNMTRSENLWVEIEKQIVTEELINQKQLDRIGKAILSSKITIGDWQLVIESTLLTEVHYDN